MGDGFACPLQVDKEDLGGPFLGWPVREGTFLGYKVMRKEQPLAESWGSDTSRH
jgi:hypothetical protein